VPLDDAARSSQIRAVGTAFLRTRPWVVAPVAALNLACLVRADVPPLQLRGLGLGISALLSFFVYEAVRYRRVPAREDQLRRSLLITAGALLLACAATGGPRSPMLPLLLAPVGITFAAFGRGRTTALLLGAAIAGLTVLSFLPQGTPFPPIPAPEAALMTLGSVTVALVLLWFGVTGLSDAYLRSGEALARTRGAALDAIAGHAHDVESIGARVAHEIRNPLTAIKGLVQLLARGEHDERTTKRLDVVLAEVGRVEDTLAAYLGYARPLAALRPAPIDLGDLLRDLAALLEGRAGAARVQLRVLAEPRTTILADRQRLQEALLNLASNAIEAMPDGGALDLRAAAIAGGAAIDVVDDGRGMDPEQIARLGTPFETTRPGGTGLGVAHAKAVVAQHGGRIVYTSAPGRGTRVTLTLPAEPGGALPDGEAADRR
jgi:signal transduction histidine kinase